MDKPRQTRVRAVNAILEVPTLAGLLVARRAAHASHTIERSVVSCCCTSAGHALLLQHTQQLLIPEEKQPAGVACNEADHAHSNVQRAHSRSISLAESYWVVPKWHAIEKRNGQGQRGSGATVCGSNWAVPNATHCNGSLPICLPALSCHNALLSQALHATAVLAALRRS